MKTPLLDRTWFRLALVTFTTLIAYSCAFFLVVRSGPRQAQVVSVVSSGRVPVDEARRVFRVSTGDGAGSAVPVARVGGLVAFLTCAHVTSHSPPSYLTDLEGRDYAVAGFEASPTTDAAVVWVSADVQPLRLLESVPPFGTRVFAAGWPCARDLVLTEGFIGGRDRSVGQSFSAPVYLGNSGGAVLDESGAVVGLVQKMWTEQVPIPHMGYLLPVSEFSTWLADALTRVPKVR